MPSPLILVGCGKMGAALLAGWLAQGLSPRHIVVVEPSPGPRAKAARLGVRAVAQATDLPKNFAPSMIVLAVKPQVIEQVAPAYGRFAQQACYLSIAAGRAIAGFERMFGPKAAVVRAMPNLPAAVGRGMSVACANAKVSKAARKRCQDLLAAVGKVAWIEDETLLDAVTAVSGSGPAYVFLLIECLAEAGRAAGLDGDLAMLLARATVSGAGELADRAKEPAAQLRQSVTSPGGTTEAALKVLMANDGLQAILTRAVLAARDRSRQLAG
jgi:pyrroline-5-carboxylate reductase